MCNVWVIGVTLSRVCSFNTTQFPLASMQSTSPSLHTKGGKSLKLSGFGGL